MRSRIASRDKAGFALALMLAAASALAAAPQQAPAPGVKTAEQVYKNIQVLKGTPASEIVPMMRFISSSLGVQCEFCHVEGDRSKDTKDTKGTARDMIKMVLALNKDSFNGRNEVSCYTCHHGRNDPRSVPDVRMATVSAEAPEAAPAAKPPTADQILARYVAALGGEQAVRRVTSRLITGTREYIGPGDKMTQAPVEHYEEAPNRMAIYVHASNGTTAIGFDGSTAWSQNNKGAVSEASGRALERARRNANFYDSLELKQDYRRIVVRGVEKVGDRDAYLVVAFPRGDTPERLFFDTQTGLLLRKWTVLPTPIGNSPTQVDYSDYREVDGVKLPFLIRIAGLSPMDGSTIRVEKVQDNVPIDESKFAKPESRAAAQ